MYRTFLVQLTLTISQKLASLISTKCYSVHVNLWIRNEHWQHEMARLKSLTSSPENTHGEKTVRANAWDYGPTANQNYPTVFWRSATLPAMPFAANPRRRKTRADCSSVAFSKSHVLVYAQCKYCRSGNIHQVLIFANSRTSRNLLL